MKPIIEVKNFSKKFGSFVAVDDISFEVDEGSIFAFLGPNGAGKSTTINALCTIIDKTSGEVLINQKNIQNQKNEVRESIGVVFQEKTLDEKMTVAENIRMHCTFYAVPKSEVNERIDFVLNIVDLKNSRDTYVSALSGGMKRRVEIARALSHYPKVLFLDEPTTGLDPQTRASIWEYIVKLQKEKNITIFLTTHYMEEAEISNQIAIIDGGKIVAKGTPYQLKKKYTKDIAYITMDESKVFEVDIEKSGLTFLRKKGYYRVEVSDVPKFLDVLSIYRKDVSDIEVKKGTLNDVFLKITGKNIREDAS